MSFSLTEKEIPHDRCEEKIYNRKRVCTIGSRGEGGGFEGRKGTRRKGDSVRGSLSRLIQRFPSSIVDTESRVIVI